MTPGELAAVKAVDEWIDAGASAEYQAQPLALQWLRVGKLAEEEGESIAELISATGGNPRKPHDPAALDRLLKELADRAWTAILAIQHCTKDTARTDEVLGEVLAKIWSRVP